MREPFMRLDPSKLGHSAAPTLIVLFIGSIVATIIGTFFFVSGTIMFGLSGLALGPAILGLLPVILAQAGVLLGTTVFVVPLWAICCGYFFAGVTAGRGGSMSYQLDMKMLPDDHKIVAYVQEMANHLDLPRIAYVGYYESKDINAFAAGLHKD